MNECKTSNWFEKYCMDSCIKILTVTSINMYHLFFSQDFVLLFLLKTNIFVIN